MTTHQPIWIERVRLLKKLEAAVHHKLSLVIAPPGYGKTTLLKQFVQSTAHPTLWQPLGSQDEDLPVFLEHLLTTLSVLVPDIDVQSLPFGRTPNESAPLIAKHLDDHVKTDLLLVMDDVHHFLKAQAVRTWLTAFIENLPSTCHLILAGQSLPPLQLTSLLAKQQVMVIGPELLSFSAPEIIQLAEKLDSRLGSAQIEQVFSRMLGWPAGTFLALQPLASELEPSFFEGKQAPEALFDTLAERLFAAQSPLLQAFLLSSSTLERMTPVLCQKVLQLPDATAQLQTVLDRNLFVTDVPGGMVYHALFRDFLQRRFQQQNPMLYVQQHRDAGSWFETENQLAEAFDHYAAAQLWTAAANIAERSAHMYLGQGKPEILLHWEQVLSTAKVKPPRFSHVCAMIHRDRYEYDLALSSAKDAEAGFEANGDMKGTIQVALLRATIDNQRGYFEEAVHRAKPFAHAFTIPENLRGYAQVIVGTALLHLNQLDEALEQLKAALPLWRNTNDQYAIAQLLTTLEVAYLRTGQFSDAAQCLQEILSIRRQFGERSGIVAALNNLAYHYHICGQYEQALQTIREARQMSSLLHESRITGALDLSKGDIQRDRGAFQEAAELYQQALQQIADHEPFIRANILISFANLCRWEGKLDEAGQLASEAQLLCESHHLNWEQLLVRTALYGIQVQQGQFAGIRQELYELIEAWQTHPAPQMAQAIGIYAYGALRSNDEAEAHRILKFATANARHPANLQPLIAEIVHNPALNDFIRQHSIRYAMLVAGIKSLETVWLGQGDNQPESIRTYSLRVSVLGREHIERDGVTIPLSAWQAISARKLFYHLLFKGASSKEDISLALWPDSSDQQIRGKFHETLRRARKAVGNDVILFEEDQYFLNPRVQICCDAFEFQSLVRQAQVNSPLLAHTEDLWHRAVDLYQGDFLVGFDEEWIEANRELLAKLHSDSLLALADCIRTRGKPQEAIPVLKQALQADPYREDIFRMLLNCFHLLGEQGLIRQHLNDLTKLLKADLGVSPSYETMALVRKFLR